MPARDFSAVCNEHVWRVYGFFAYRTRNRADAEDLTQQTFERALKAWSRYDPARANVDDRHKRLRGRRIAADAGLVRSWCRGAYLVHMHRALPALVALLLLTLPAAALGQGRSPIGEVLDVATGDDGGAGMGALLPAILLASLLGAIALVPVRRRSAS